MINMSLSIGLCQGKKLEGKAIAKHNSKTIESSYPIFNGQRPCFSNIVNSQENDLVIFIDSIALVV